MVRGPGRKKGPPRTPEAQREYEKLRRRASRYRKLHGIPNPVGRQRLVKPPHAEAGMGTLAVMMNSGVPVSAAVGQLAFKAPPLYPPQPLPLRRRQLALSSARRWRARR